MLLREPLSCPPHPERDPRPCPAPGSSSRCLRPWSPRRSVAGLGGCSEPPGFTCLLSRSSPRHAAVLPRSPHANASLSPAGGCSQAPCQLLTALSRCSWGLCLRGGTAGALPSAGLGQAASALCHRRGCPQLPAGTGHGELGKGLTPCRSSPLRPPAWQRGPHPAGMLLAQQCGCRRPAWPAHTRGHGAGREQVPWR